MLHLYIDIEPQKQVVAYQRVRLWNDLAEVQVLPEPVAILELHVCLNDGIIIYIADVIHIKNLYCSCLYFMMSICKLACVFTYGRRHRKHCRDLHHVLVALRSLRTPPIPHLQPHQYPTLTPPMPHPQLNSFPTPPQLSLNSSLSLSLF